MTSFANSIIMNFHHTPAEHELIEHIGQECPVDPELRVEVQWYSASKPTHTTIAGCLWWGRQTPPASYQIAFYRIVKDLTE